MLFGHISVCRDSILTNTQSSYIQGIIYASQILQQPVSADGGHVAVTKKLESVASSGSGHDCICITLLYLYPYQDHNTGTVL